MPTKASNRFCTDAVTFISLVVMLSLIVVITVTTVGGYSILFRVDRQEAVSAIANGIIFWGNRAGLLFNKEDAQKKQTYSLMELAISRSFKAETQ